MRTWFGPGRASVALGQRFRAEHRELLGVVDRVRAVAGGLDRLPPPLALAEVAAVHRFLTERLLPHEEAEDALLYPVVAELVGGVDPGADEPGLCRDRPPDPVARRRARRPWAGRAGG
jgi:hypothetical protein